MKWGPILSVPYLQYKSGSASISTLKIRIARIRDYIFQLKLNFLSITILSFIKNAFNPKLLSFETITRCIPRNEVPFNMRGRGH